MRTAASSGNNRKSPVPHLFGEAAGGGGSLQYHQLRAPHRPLVVDVGRGGPGRMGALPSPSWPRSFRRPVVRVVGSDVRAVVQHDISHHGTTSTPTERRLVTTLAGDAARSAEHAPTAQLRRRLRRHASDLQQATSMNQVDYAFSTFGQKARSQLGECGARPA